mmetsp:Transcript_9997/g.29849  ORF Transcript_9997/g.29849 Transcript_9997/m.29849 type:complete len:254 (+) Transcript_9997:1085-1846(+)
MALRLRSCPSVGAPRAKPHAAERRHQQDRWPCWARGAGGSLRTLAESCPVRCLAAAAATAALRPRVAEAPEPAPAARATAPPPVAARAVAAWAVAAPQALEPAPVAPGPEHRALGPVRRAPGPVRTAPGPLRRARPPRALARRGPLRNCPAPRRPAGAEGPSLQGPGRRNQAAAELPPLRARQSSPLPEGRWWSLPAATGSSRFAVEGRSGARTPPRQPRASPAPPRFAPGALPPSAARRRRRAWGRPAGAHG